jgi:hypothetical protein
VSAAEPAGVRYVRDLGPADVGSRVVVRHALPAGGTSDLLGVLLAWDEQVVVRDRSGVEHAVDRTAVVAGKPVPPAPERRR